MAVARSKDRRLVGGGFWIGGFGGIRTVVSGSDGEEDLAYVHTGYASVGLSPCSAHSGLESVGSSTR